MAQDYSLHRRFDDRVAECLDMTEGRLPVQYRYVLYSVV